MKKNLRSISICLCLIGLYTSFMPISVFAQEQSRGRELRQFDRSTRRVIAPVRIGIPKDHAYIPQGTELAVELVKELNSKHNRTGDQVELKLVDNLIVNDVVVAPAGTAVQGIITKSRKAGGLGRSGVLEFQINSFNTINNVKIPLSYSQKGRGGTDGGAGVVFAAVSILGGLLMKGKNVYVQPGTKFNCVVSKNTDLNVKLDDLADVMSPDRPHGVSITIK